jgi:hypothetical protein
LVHSLSYSAFGSAALRDNAAAAAVTKPTASIFFISVSYFSFSNNSATATPQPVGGWEKNRVNSALPISRNGPFEAFPILSKVEHFLVEAQPDRSLKDLQRRSHRRKQAEFFENPGDHPSPWTVTDF